MSHKRDIDRRRRANLRAGAGEADVGAQEIPIVFVDLERIFAEQIAGAGFMYMGSHGLRHVERFAKADMAFIGVDLHPQHIGKFGEIDGVDGSDFHGGPLSFGKRY